MTTGDRTESLDAAGLRLSVDPPVARVTLARPEDRNAQSPATWRALADFGDALGPDVRVVILDSMGPSFSAGLDRRMFDGTGGSDEPNLADLAALDEHTLDAVIAGYQGAFTWWRDSAAITIAAVQGHAVGAGFQLALACDLIVCADDARFAMRETSLGLVPDLGGTGPLVAAVGYRRALEICSTGRWVGAQEAVDLGIALTVAPAGELDAAVAELTAALLVAPAGAVRETKALLRNALTSTPDEQREAERAAQARRLASMRSARTD